MIAKRVAVIVCCREAGQVLGGECHVRPFDLHPNRATHAVTLAKLNRYVCDRHGHPILIVPAGTFSKAVA